jgi:hypothetical protein
MFQKAKNFCCYFGVTPQSSKDGKIVTAKGSCNREINKEEKEFLQVYCRKKSIQLEL